MGTQPPPGTPCTCPARAGLCDISVCQQPWAVKYRQDVQPRWYERAIGTIVAFLMGRW